MGHGGPRYPTGPLGMRSRWHEFLSRFDLTVGYIPGVENTVADALSRWEYPASLAWADMTKHGSVQDKEDMEGFLEEERRDEKMCMSIGSGRAETRVHSTP